MFVRHTALSMIASKSISEHVKSTVFLDGHVPRPSPASSFDPL